MGSTWDGTGETNTSMRQVPAFQRLRRGEKAGVTNTGIRATSGSNPFAERAEEPCPGLEEHAEGQGRFEPDLEDRCDVKEGFNGHGGVSKDCRSGMGSCVYEASRQSRDDHGRC